MSAQGVSAPELFAISQGKKNTGSERCFWCGGSAEASPQFLRDGQHNPPAGRHPGGARFPQGRHVCLGDWLYRRESVTVFYPDDTLKDRQCLLRSSWWLTDEGIRALRKEDAPHVYKALLNPPPLFCLSLLSAEPQNGKLITYNQIHLACVNDLAEVRADTPLAFTLDNVRHEYTVYELRETLKTRVAEGKMPGVRALTARFGMVAVPGLGDPEAKRERGRPAKVEEDRIDRVVSKK